MVSKIVQWTGKASRPIEAELAEWIAKGNKRSDKLLTEFTQTVATKRRGIRVISFKGMIIESSRN